MTPQHHLTFLLLLLLSRFSRVRLCATPQTAAHQAPPSLGFSRQEHWSGFPFPSPMHESEKSKGHLAPLMRPTKFPEIPVSLERNTEVFRHPLL